MKYINRTTEVPQGLLSLQKRYKTWDQIKESTFRGKPKPQKIINQDKEDRQDLLNALKNMQNHRCAYCEMLLENEFSVDHFHPRTYNRGSNRKDFDWHNLFLSCTSQYNCNLYKDKKQASNIFKPDDPNLQDLEHYFIYTPEGRILPSGKLDAKLKERAAETIKTLGLNSSLLMHKRREILILFLIQIEAGDTPKNYCDQLKSKIGFDSVCEYYGNHPIEFFKQLAHSLLKEKVQL